MHETDFKQEIDKLTSSLKKVLNQKETETELRKEARIYAEEAGKLRQEEIEKTQMTPKEALGCLSALVIIAILKWLYGLLSHQFGW